jgi:hypothetical protein
VRQQEVDKPGYVGEAEARWNPLMVSLSNHERDSSFARLRTSCALVADHGQMLPSPEFGMGWKTLPRYQDLRFTTAAEALGEDDVDAVGHQPH